MIKVEKFKLLMIAGILWLIAGFNVLMIGLKAYQNNVILINILLSGVIFLLFWFKVFMPMTNKHYKRIVNFTENRQAIYRFFDLKSYLIMFFMMGMGIVIRKFNLWPNNFIAVFYTGLGLALFLAGVLNILNYIKTNRF